MEISSIGDVKLKLVNVFCSGLFFQALTISTFWLIGGGFGLSTWAYIGTLKAQPKAME